MKYDIENDNSGNFCITDTDAHYKTDAGDKDILPMREGPIPFTLRNNYMFKAVFQTNEHVLKGLLSSLLNMDIEDIRDIRIENPIILGNAVEQKDMILDIIIMLNNNSLINVEMQVRNESDWPDRSLSYLCRMFDQLKTGEKYINVKRTVHIGILDFELFDGDDTFYSENLFMDRNTHRIFSSRLALNVLSLRHIENATEKDHASGLYEWAGLFRATTWEELKSVSGDNEMLKEVVKTMSILTEEDRIRLQCANIEYHRGAWTYMEKQIRDRDEQIQVKDEQIQVKDEQIQVKDEQIRQNQEEIKKLTAQLQQDHDEIVKLTELLKQNH